jgi:hypothetical protein
MPANARFLSLGQCFRTPRALDDAAVCRVLAESVQPAAGDVWATAG